MYSKPQGIAVLEPLEIPLRAHFGQMLMPVASIAVLEPLEAALRARFGQMVMPVTLIAVLEPLEIPLRAQFGQTGRTRALLHRQERHLV